MMKIHWSRLLLVTLITCASLGAFSNNGNTPLMLDMLTDPDGGTGGGPIAGSLTVTVIASETGQPLANAFVMAGPAPDDPFAGNWGWTDAQGMITFVDGSLQGATLVTAGAENRRMFTIAGADANDVVIPLATLEGPGTTYQIGDFVSGIDVNNGIFHAGDGNVDAAFVMPTFDLDMLLTFDMDSLIGPMETMEILGEIIDVPSNFFIPQQWELFIEIVKDHYYLYLESGDYTLTALSGRVPTADLLDFIGGGGEITDLIPLLDWREIDVLDVTVTGATNSADLTVDPDLVDTVTLTINNIPENSIAYGISAGDLDDLHGLGRIVPLGFSAIDCPTGGGDCNGALTLTTTAASGEFAGMGYLPAVVIQSATGEILAILDRATHPQTYSATLDDFFQYLTLSYATGVFSWNDVENSTTASPQVDLNQIAIKDATTGVLYWKMLAPGAMTQVAAPLLPPEAPAPVSSGITYAWDHNSFALTYDSTSFDFNSFAFADVSEHVSHVSLHTAEVLWYVPAPTATPSPSPTATMTPTALPTATPVPTTTPPPPSPTPMPPSATPPPPTVTPLPPTDTPTAPTPPPPTATPAIGMIGDIDNDGRITTSDALLCFQIALSLYSPTPEEEYRADADQDGRVTTADALCIFQEALSLPNDCFDL